MPATIELGKWARYADFDATCGLSNPSPIWLPEIRLTYTRLNPFLVHSQYAEYSYWVAP